MIVLLYEPRQSGAAELIASALRRTYHGIDINLVGCDVADKWPSEESWDDMLIVPFDDKPMSDRGASFANTQIALGKRQFILPVATTLQRVPPAPLGHLKAVPYEAGNLDRVCARVGAILGLRLRRRDQTIFISYRAIDGTDLAEQLEQFLVSNGYKVWRDDSKDTMDGQTMIAPGEDVQESIERNLLRADMLLLMDTPRAAESYWIKLEIDAANGDLIPVLPVFFKLPTDRKLQCSRFRALESLQRACVIESPGMAAPNRLSDAELERVLLEMESYLKEIFQRKLRVPYLVEEVFRSHQYTWTARDRFIYEAVRDRGGMIRTRVFSHCSFYDGIFDPALRAFVSHLEKTNPPANYALYIYDGSLIPLAQLAEIERAARLDGSSHVILLHHEELRALLHSNFTSRK